MIESPSLQQSECRLGVNTLSDHCLITPILKTASPLSYPILKGCKGSSSLGEKTASSQSSGLNHFTEFVEINLVVLDLERKKILGNW